MLEYLILAKFFRFSKALNHFKNAFISIKEELVLFLVAAIFLVFLSSIGIRGNIKTVFPAAGTREIGQEASELAAEQAVVRGKKAKILEAILDCMIV